MIFHKAKLKKKIVLSFLVLSSIDCSQKFRIISTMNSSVENLNYLSRGGL